MDGKFIPSLEMKLKIENGWKNYIVIRDKDILLKIDHVSLVEKEN